DRLVGRTGGILAALACEQVGRIVLVAHWLSHHATPWRSCTAAAAAVRAPRGPVTCLGLRQAAWRAPDTSRRSEIARARLRACLAAIAGGSTPARRSAARARRARQAHYPCRYGGKRRPHPVRSVSRFAGGLEACRGSDGSRYRTTMPAMSIGSRSARYR